MSFFVPNMAVVSNALVCFSYVSLFTLRLSAIPTVVNAIIFHFISASRIFVIAWFITLVASSDSLHQSQADKVVCGLSVSADMSAIFESLAVCVADCLCLLNSGSSAQFSK